MIYIAANKSQDINVYIVRQGLDVHKVRAVTHHNQLIGLTGGKLYLLPSFKFNIERDEILASAKDRFIQMINIAESCPKEELLKMEQSHD